MGFFSAVKKFFGQKTEADEAATLGGATRTAPGAESAFSDVVAESGQDDAGRQSGAAPDARKTAAGMTEGPEELRTWCSQGQKDQGGKLLSVAEELEAAPVSESVGLHGADTAEVLAATAVDVEPSPRPTAKAVEQAVPTEGLGGASGVQAETEAEAALPPEDMAVEPEGAGAACSGDQGAGARIQVAEAGQSAEEASLIARLREAEPRLSLWLDIILEGQEEVNENFWQRLRFLLRSLEAPQAETDAFLADFEQWLRRMDYVHVDEFRSELQYRLALALDLEDEEDERNRLLLKLSQGLAATREKLGQGLNALFSRHGELDDVFWEELEELFIMADLGYDTALEIVARLKRRAARGNVTAAAGVSDLLREELEEIFRQEPKIKAVNKPEVVLMMGVNGAGKTTTIAKLAHRERMAGKKVLVAAADTFRAAAIEQLQVWAERAGAEFYARPAGSDPASVAYGAMDYALENAIDIVFVDTAGRLQTRANLMEELGKIRQVLSRKHHGAPHRNVLVLDATTGQNALSQAKLFREAAGADELILTKLDGTAKGGVAIAVAMQEGLPITYIGLGEKMDDLRPFSGGDFARALLDSGE